MTFLEKLKVNLDYLLGKANPELYADNIKASKLRLKDWQNRWGVFSDNGCGYVWFGVDADGCLAQFNCETSYIPETFFQDADKNEKLKNHILNLPDITTANLPDTLRPELKKIAERDYQNSVLKMWMPLKEAQVGVFIFYEVIDNDWYKSELYKSKKYGKNPYELLAIPNKCLKISDLPNGIQELLKPYQFKNLKFIDCQFLDVSQYLYCEN